MDNRMTFTEALSKLITKDMECHPEWSLTHAGRIDACAALYAANEQKEQKAGMAR